MLRLPRAAALTGAPVAPTPASTPAGRSSRSTSPSTRGRGAGSAAREPGDARCAGSRARCPDVRVRRASRWRPRGSTRASRRCGGATSTACATTRAGPTRCAATRCCATRRPLDSRRHAGRRRGCWSASTTSRRSAGAARAPPPCARCAAPCAVGADRRRLTEATVVADAFCHSMVRSLVGACFAVGEGRHDVDWLAPGARRAPRPLGGPGRGPRGADARGGRLPARRGAGGERRRPAAPAPVHGADQPFVIRTSSRSPTNWSSPPGSLAPT